jgi:HSP20 family protein
VDDLFSEFPGFFKNDPAVTNRKGITPVNIIESEKGFRLEIVAPGFEKSDFKVTLDQTLLTISGERKVEQKNEEGKKVRSEYGYPGFKRSFTLNETVDATQIAANYINGVLILNLPKKEEVKEAAKEIEIR